MLGDVMDHAFPQEALDVTVWTRDSHRHGAESRASSSALLKDVVALWRPQVSKDCHHRNGAPMCVGEASRGLVATHGEKLQWTLTERGSGVVFTVASRALRRLQKMEFLPTRLVWGSLGLVEAHDGEPATICSPRREEQLRDRWSQPPSRLSSLEVSLGLLPSERITLSS